MSPLDTQIFGLVTIAGFVYGYISFGTPLLPRRSLKTMLQISGTSMFVYSIFRNLADESAPLTRLLPVILWQLAVLLGGYLHSTIDFKYSFRDLFAQEFDVIPPITPVPPEGSEE